MKKFVLLVGIVMLTLSSAFVKGAPSDPLQRTQAALNMIRQIANDMCEQVPLTGSQQNWELSGEIKAKLDNLLKAAVDAGFSGAAKYKTSDYNGLLQRDLLAAQRNLNECRKHYFDSLKDKVLSPVNVNPKASPVNPAKVSLTIDDFTLDKQTRTLQLRGVFSNALANPVTVTSVSFSARHDEHQGRMVIAEPQWIPLSIAPNAATPYSFLLHLSERHANDFAQPENLPQQIFIDLRAVDSRGNASATTKHFMTMSYSRECHCVLGTLFAMPLAILDNTTPIYMPGKNTFIVARGLMPALD